MNVAILGPADAAAMLHGTGRFEPYGAIALRVLTPVDGRLLLARADFPERHAWLVTGALAGTDLASAPQPPGDSAGDSGRSLASGQLSLPGRKAGTRR